MASSVGANMERVSEHRSGKHGRLARARHSGSGVTGLRRVDWIRVVVDHHEVHAEAVGVGHRLPATCPIPLSTAAALIAEGIPSITQRVARSPRGHLAVGPGSER
ncbi:MAG TPA: hypothetical protein VGL60_01570 [Acidimicrobiales bacterium]|jgi:hypothetical protein